MEPPLISCPDDIFQLAHYETNDREANVSWSLTVSDDAAIRPEVICLPKWNSSFEIGETRVVCEAWDISGNVGQCSFNIFIQKGKPSFVPLKSISFDWVKPCWNIIFCWSYTEGVMSYT